jgi:CRP/FNR family transcriptional regulator, cyclic AMP receptor protein
MCQFEQNMLSFDVILRGGNFMKTGQAEFPEASLSDVRKEMAVPRMAQSVQRAISKQNWKSNQPLRSNMKAPPKISFDLSGVATRNASLGTGAVVFSKGDFARTLMYIQSGRVKLSAASKTDKEATVAILGPGEFLGEVCLGNQNLRVRTAIAIAPTALKVIEKNEMIRALHADHALSYAFLSYMLSRNIRLEEDLFDQVSQCSERRLARVLLLLSGKGDRRKPHSFAGISQGTLATMIGTTRSRVNFFMNKFRMLGFIKYHGTLDANGGLHINSSRLAKAFCK